MDHSIELPLLIFCLFLSRIYYRNLQNFLFWSLLIQRTLSRLFDFLAFAEIIKTRFKADPILAFFKHSSRRLIVFIKATHSVGANPSLINPAAVLERRVASYRRKSNGKGRNSTRLGSTRRRRRRSGQDGATSERVDKKLPAIIASVR